MTKSAAIAEYKISDKTPINYYYPYLHKIGLVFFPESSDSNFISAGCDDSNCHQCNILQPNLCLKCSTGFYLLGNNCEYECPNNYIADVLRQKCIRVEEVDRTSIFSKTYTIGSCINQCGKPKLTDCSCKSSCKNSGTCCFDYSTVNCENIMDMGKSVEQECRNINPKCDLCERENVKKCNQCKQNLYLYNGKCYETCPQDTTADNSNWICNDSINCTVENCADCINDSIITCKKCHRGFYLFNGRCIKICPMGYRADRISWSCLEYPVFSWYYVLPSRGSCKKSCGDKKTDCACDSQCIFRGDCCQDFDEFCVNFSILRKFK